MTTGFERSPNHFRCSDILTVVDTVSVVTKDVLYSSNQHDFRNALSEAKHTVLDVVTVFVTVATVTAVRVVTVAVTVRVLQ